MGEEVKEECVAFLKAVSDMMPEKCGFTPSYTVEIEGTGVKVPTEEVRKLMGEYHELTHEEKVKKMEEESEWLRNLSTGWIKKVFPYFEPSTAEFKKAREAFAHKVAEGMVSKFAA